jgi:glycosyltransferase involved in cell wall biosynthesis
MTAAVAPVPAEEEPPGSLLRVAVVAPPWFEIPPRGYGGVESMCFDLIEGLLERGHEVTLLGVGHNGTGAAFVQLTELPQADRIGEAMPEVLHAGALPRALASLQVDVVHDHTLVGPLLAPIHKLPTVVTAHGPVSDDMARYYRQIGDDTGLVAISEAQRTAAPEIPWLGMVHNAVTVSNFPFRADKEDFALFLGRLSPDKGLPYAIDAATAAGMPLRIAAKCNEPDELEYFRAEVEPRLNQDIEWLGEVGGDDKLALLAAARCLLFPICWEEPFGLVMIEAMACGTPVVALRRGSVPEVVVDGVSGFICDSPDELAAALHKVDRLDPACCREVVSTRFDTSTMVAGYSAIYRGLAER